MSFQIRLAWRYLAGRKLRNTLTTLAILFGVMIIVGMSALAPALKETFEKSMAAASLQMDLLITRQLQGMFPASLVEKVGDVPGVTEETGLISRELYLSSAQAFTTSDGSQVTTLEVYGLDPNTGSALYGIIQSEGRRLVAGRMPRPLDGNVIVLSRPMADGMGLALGETLELPGASGRTAFEVIGILSDYGLVVGVEQVFMPLAAAQALFNMPNQINGIIAQYEAGVDEALVKENVLAALGAGFQIGSAQGGADAFATAMQMMDVIFTMFGVMTLAMAGFIMYNTFQTVVVERRHDIGMLRAIGAGRRTVMNLVLLESLIQGITGTLLGMLAGFLLALGAVPLISPVWSRLLHAPLGQPVITAPTLVIAVVFGLGIPILSAIIPARAAGRVTPLEALRPSTASYQRRAAGKRALTGAALIAASLLGLVSGQIGLISLGVVIFLAGLLLVGPVLVYPIADVFGRLLTLALAREGRIAQGNLVRQPNRATITASTMTISLAIMVALGGLATTLRAGMLGYLETSLQADYLLMPEALVLGEGNAGAQPELAQEVLAVPGVAEITTLRRAETQSGEQGWQVIGIDPSSYPRVSGLTFTAGSPETAYAELGRDRNIIINGFLAMQSGSQVGDELSLHTATGSQTYRVVAIAVDFINAKVGTGYISQANLAQDFQVSNDQVIMANLAPAADQQAVESSLVEIASDYPSFGVLSYDKLRAAQVENLGALVAGLYTVMLLLAIPSLLALANTLGINVLERTREIGVMRAVGATRRQVRRMIVGESLLLVAMGSCFGILAGIWLGYVMVSAMSFAGLPMPYHFPFSGIFIAIAAGLIFGILAALLPARRAAGLEIVRALAYE